MLPGEGGMLRGTSPFLFPCSPVGAEGPAYTSVGGGWFKNLKPLCLVCKSPLPGAAQQDQGTGRGADSQLQPGGRTSASGSSKIIWSGCAKAAAGRT